MGTTWSVRMIVDEARRTARLAAMIQSALDEIVREMSQWEADSDLSRFNRAPAGTWVALPDCFAAVVAEALAIAEWSEGAFDPTVGAATEAWGFGAKPIACLPDPTTVIVARNRAGWERLAFDHETKRLLQPGGIELDLCAIAKGFGVDRVAQVLRFADVQSFLVEVGGELRARGLKSDLQPWWVELEAPEDATLPPLRVALSGWSAATSGHTRRFHDLGGTRIGHSIDPASGWPVAGTIESVTVLARTAMRADALTTALMVLGEEALPFATRHDIPARIVRRDGKHASEELTPAFARMLD